MIDIDVKHPTLLFTKEEVEQILAQYNRTLENVQVDIDCIQTWIESQPHLSHKPDDKLILSFLILNKFAIEKTKTKVDYYYSMKSMIPEIFTNYYPSNENIVHIRKIIRCLVLPKLINLNRVAIMVHDEMHHTFNGYISLAKIFMEEEALLYRDINSGLEIILDSSRSNFTFWATYTPIMTKICVDFIKKVMSNRLQAMRFIGLPPFAETVVSFAVSLLPKKMKDRVTFHKKATEVLQFYPKEQLPVEFGGNGRPFREMSAEFDDMVDKCEEFFRDLEKYKVDEKLRPTPLNNDEILGFHGNFRKLEVD